MAIPAVNSTTLSPSPLENLATQKSKPAPKPAADTDTVKISAAAKSLQERTVASSEIVQEAAAGDVQAQAQLAKPTASVSVKG